MNFASDNAAPVAAPIMEALVAANTGPAMPYGADPWMPQVRDRLRDLFAWPEAEVLLVATGTGANALALAGLVAPWQTIFAHRISHIEEDECAAPEFYTGGAKLTLVEGAHGRMSPDTLRAAMAPVGAKGVHGVQLGALSLTNVTEAGTLYTVEEMRALTDIARAAGMPRHLDGARLANACVALDRDVADMVQGFDVVSFGGTKNGCMAVEAIVLKDGARYQEMQFRRKRGAQLWSKHRYLSAQMLAYLRDDLWLVNARRANDAARHLANGLRAIGAEMVHEPQANMIFCRLPRTVHDRARTQAAYYMMEESDRPLCRFVCDFTKTDVEVEALLALMRG
ncbi:beta-eliminating lyase-related protein [Jannaschia sp. S6380]|nr:beta-eliminating lyase-related protein [Jannaschia sp. S6380]MCK0167582.1 beta-eliminating lyase-related protein [Jannaschia sp. S6380]